MCKPSRSFLLLPLLALLPLLPFAASGDRTASANTSLGNAGAFFLGFYEDEDDDIVQANR